MAVCARDRFGRLHVETRADRARRLAFADAERFQRAARRAGREDRVPRVHADVAVAAFERRAGHLAVALDCAREPKRRDEACAALDRRDAHKVVEPMSRHARHFAPQRHRRAARRVHAHSVEQRRFVQYALLQPQPFERAQRVGDQAVAAHLFARERKAVDDQHVAPALGERQRSRGTRRAAADDEHFGFDPAHFGTSV
jgi:hypothetical protein